MPMMQLGARDGQLAGDREVGGVPVAGRPGKAMRRHPRVEQAERRGRRAAGDLTGRAPPKSSELMTDDPVHTFTAPWLERTASSEAADDDHDHLSLHPAQPALAAAQPERSDAGGVVRP